MFAGDEERNFWTKLCLKKSQYFCRSAPRQNCPQEDKIVSLMSNRSGRQQTKLYPNTFERQSFVFSETLSRDKTVPQLFGDTFVSQKDTFAQDSTNRAAPQLGRVHLRTAAGETKSSVFVVPPEHACCSP